MQFWSIWAPKFFQIVININVIYETYLLVKHVVFCKQGKTMSMTINLLRSFLVNMKGWKYSGGWSSRKSCTKQQGYLSSSSSPSLSCLMLWPADWRQLSLQIGQVAAGISGDFLSVASLLLIDFPSIPCCVSLFVADLAGPLCIWWDDEICGEFLQWSFVRVDSSLIDAVEGWLIFVAFVEELFSSELIDGNEVIIYRNERQHLVFHGFFKR